tara:strand:- start:1949 stop:3061 length:1113 start_codon:yes stop_codon:yes gene_type:complete
MKINLKLIKIRNLICLMYLLVPLTCSLHLYSSENRIIFKIDNSAFTSLDLEKRLEYLDFVGGNQNLDQNIIIDDFISANLFYKYYKNLENKKNYESKINEIFEEIYTVNKNNNKIYSYEIENENILKNIRIDYIRKIVLENIFNASINNIRTSSEEIDLLYNIKIKYINIETTEFNKLQNNIPNLKISDYDSIILFLDENKLNYFTKKKEINNINNIDKKIKKNILLNNNFFIIEKEKVKSLIFIEKEFETLEGIIADLYSIKSEDELTDNFLKCDNLIKISKNKNIINKEYKLVDLNNNLKNNLININDYVKYLSNDQNIYIVLCNIKFDKEILDNINFNKIINLNISEIEKKFINKYSKIYNLIVFNE